MEHTVTCSRAFFSVAWIIIFLTSIISLEFTSYSAQNDKNYTNILLILADDLGYGDLSVRPFLGSGIQTPELERMAQRGTIMTNFHTAAATCTPTRASILTGLYPWRLGIKAVYEYGEKIPGKSNRDDWLPQVLSSAMVFRDFKYFTGHSGKWHLGGMRNDDLDMRLLSPHENNRAHQKCPHPGPHQQGFEEYVSVLDGPGAPRQNELQVNSNLHSRGCNHLLRNDILIRNEGGNGTEFLSDCEGRHAIDMISRSVKLGRPFFIHLWFHAPHGPWEELPGFEATYPDSARPSVGSIPLCDKNLTARFCQRANTRDRIRRESGGASRPSIVDRGPSNMEKYRTMVTAMDRSIGRVLAAVRSLGIEKNTLVVFTSDNGPEDRFGSTAGFKGNKRFLYEGGIRVPSIWQWVGTIPKGRTVSSFGVTTDLFPTFLHAAGIKVPDNARLDGISLLPELVPSIKNRKAGRKANADRVTLWHGDFEGPRASAAWLLDFKLVLDSAEYPKELYDMKFDPFEKYNLLVPYLNLKVEEMIQYKPPTEGDDVFNMSLFLRNRSAQATADQRSNRNSTVLYRLIVAKVYKTLYNFVSYGNEAHTVYLALNRGRLYQPTVESDIRYSRHNVYKHITKEVSRKQHDALMKSTCSTPCSCNIPSGSDIAVYPFAWTKMLMRSVFPGNLHSAPELLQVQSAG